jgi:hypothetical protein
MLYPQDRLHFLLPTTGCKQKAARNKDHCTSQKQHRMNAGRYCEIKYQSNAYFLLPLLNSHFSGIVRGLLGD